MKIYQHTRKYKAFNYSRSKKRAKNSLKRRKKKYQAVEISIRPSVPRKEISNLVAPSVFSIVENTEEVLSYFNQAKDLLLNGSTIRFDISKIQTLTTDAIALQIAIIKSWTEEYKKYILGNSPDDNNLKQLFLQSGFYNYVSTFGPKPKFNHTLIHKVTKNKVEPHIAKEACIIGLKHTFGNEDIFDPLYDIIIEIMQNTNNHAGRLRGMYDWWLHIYNDPVSKTSKYTFLDLGVGIFESLPARSFKERLMDLVGLKENIALVDPLFNGEIKSRTGLPERGKGLPQVYESSQDQHFKQFILISNDLFIDLKSGARKKLNSEFSGTLYYWELQKV